MSKTKDPLLHKLPPQNIEAEEALISAVLIDNSTLNEIIEILSPEDFYKHAHKIIFSNYKLHHGFVTPQDWLRLNKAGEQLAAAPINIDDSSDTTVWPISS
jgi:replicative DNA helicase